MQCSGFEEPDFNCVGGGGLEVSTACFRDVDWRQHRVPDSADPGNQCTASGPHGNGGDVHIRHSARNHDAAALQRVPVGQHLRRHGPRQLRLRLHVRLMIFQ